MADESKFKFMAFTASLILAVSIIVMIIDMSIKAAILEESSKLRKVILDAGEKREGSNKGDNLLNHNHASNHRDVLLATDAGMEAGSSANGTEKPVPSWRKNRPVSTDDSEVPAGD